MRVKISDSPDNRGCKVFKLNEDGTEENISHGAFEVNYTALAGHIPVATVYLHHPSIDVIADASMVEEWPHETMLRRLAALGRAFVLLFEDETPDALIKQALYAEFVEVLQHKRKGNS